MNNNNDNSFYLQTKGPGDYSTRQLNSARLNAVLKYAGKSVLDIGCGSGAYVLELSNRLKINGVDYREFDSWAIQRQLFSIADAANVDVPDESYETIISFETLEHLPDPKAALREYARIASKNLILTVPNCELTPGFIKSNLLFSHWSDRTHVNFYNMQSLIDAVNDAGFKTVHSYYINELYLGAAVMEALGIKGIFARVGARVFNLLQSQKYFITCLVVAEK